jgi:GNAT superfamily N-acetyltransferase
MVTIAPLYNNPHYAPILAYWAYNEWYKQRSYGFGLVMKAYLCRAQGDSLPQSFVALEDSLPVGMGTLKLDDLWSRKDLNPWLSSLYVVPEFRGRGIGNVIVSQIIERSRGLGFKSLYLFLGQRQPERLERYYIAGGWEVFASSKDNDGRDTKILRRSLALPDV